MLRFIQHSLCYCLVCLITMSCFHHHKSDACFDRLDRLAFEHPDSALLLLQAYDSVSQTSFEGKPLNKSGRMHVELMRGVAMKKAGVDFSTDSVMLELSRFYHHHGSPNEKMMSLYLLGSAYQDLKNVPRALDSWLEAAAVADISSSDCDWGTLLCLYSQISELYGWMKISDKERFSLNTAIRLSWQAKDTISALILEEKLCVHLLDERKFKECIIEASLLQQEITESCFRDHVQILDCLLAKAYVSISNYYEAERLIGKYEHSSVFQTNPYLINGGKGLLFILKGECLLHANAPDSAIYYYREAYHDRLLWDNEQMIYYGMYRAYSILHEPDSVVKYTNMYFNSKSKKYDNDAVQTSVAKHIYDYCIEQKKERNTAFFRARLKGIILFFIFALVLFSLITALYQQNKHIYLLKLQQDYQEASLELDELREQHDAMILSKEADATLLEERKQRILYYQKRVSSLKKAIQSLRFSKKKPLEDTEIVKYFKRYFHGKMSIQEDDWQKLAGVVEEYYPLFHCQVNEHVVLSEREYRICLLSLLNFSTSEMDLLMGKANSYSTHMRKKLMGKIFGTNGSAKDFNERIKRLTED